jgi:hypothetical protein
MREVLCVFFQDEHSEDTCGVGALPASGYIKTTIVARLPCHPLRALCDYSKRGVGADMLPAPCYGAYGTKMG